MTEAAGTETTPTTETPGTETTPTQTEQNGAPAATATVETTPQGDGTQNQGTQASQETAGTEGTDDTAKEFEEIISGWKEDREALSASETENSALRDRVATLEGELAQLKGGESTEDKYAGMTPAERNKAIIADHEAKQKEETAREAKQKAGELGFMRRTSKEFRTNEAAIIKIADDLKVNLETAQKVFRGQQKAGTTAAERKAAEDKRKQEAGAHTPTATQPNGQQTPTAPAREESISDIYRKNGIN